MVIERTYTVPLRSGFRNAPKYYRTNKAMSTLRAFLVRHMKVSDENVKIGQHLNTFLWKHGIRNPPARVTINVRKDDDGIVTAELEGKTFTESVKPLAREEQPTGLKEKLQAAVGGKKGAADTEAEPEEKPEKSEAKPKAKKAPAKKRGNDDVSGSRKPTVSSEKAPAKEE
jgi:large subunit ribosomal protein L31e